MPQHTIRPVTDADRDAVIAIFNHYVTTGFAAYPDKPVPPPFFAMLREGVHAFPVAEAGGRVAGFGILRPFLPFSTFQRTATVTAFIAPEHRHRGYGTALLDTMEKEAEKRGVSVLLANISSKNDESFAFHSKHGFSVCGRMHGVGEKFGERFDVIWMQKDLARGRAV
jgi:phosphinothricin acetyltransferase